MGGECTRPGRGGGGRIPGSAPLANQTAEEWSGNDNEVLLMRISKKRMPEAWNWFMLCVVRRRWIDISLFVISRCLLTNPTHS